MTELEKYPDEYSNMLKSNPAPGEDPGVYEMRLLLLGILADKTDDENDKEELKNKQEEIKSDTSEKAAEIDKQIEESGIYHQPKKTSSGDDSEQSLEDMVSDADNFVKQGDLKYNSTALQNFSKTFYNIMLTVGVFVAVIVGAIIGIKFMVSGVEEKAEVKKLLVPYVVGCIVVFGGFGIWKIIVTILQNI